MSNAELGAGGGTSSPGGQAKRGGPNGESGRREPSPDQGAGRYTSPEAALGGADAVEKTTYVVGEATEPDARPRTDYVARGAARGSNVVVWVVGTIAALIALVYAIGVFR
jgi:hypothetical protein